MQAITRSLPALLAVLLVAPMVLAQSSSNAQGDWLPCPRCQNPQERAALLKKIDSEKRPFNGRDLSGIWGDFGLEFNVIPPPFTKKGKEMYDATRADETADGVAVSNSKDGMLICDPLGYPRLFNYNYGFQFVMLPDRVVQFFEFGHTWRDIWIDGRKLLDDPPQPRWMGYAVGRWEGDTFVIESNGYDDRSWLQEDRRDRRWGFPHTDQLRVVERYRRTSYTTLEAELSIVDNDVFKKPWVTKGTIQLRPGTELWEYMCVPSESEQYNRDKVRPQAGVK